MPNKNGTLNEMRKEQISDIPTHIAFILDGNRRWAKKNNLSINKGHEEGARNIKNLCNWCIKHNIKYLTLYCLSTENLGRQPKELKFLYSCISTYLSKDKIIEYSKDHVNIRVLGNKDLFADEIKEKITQANASICKDAKLQLQLCIGYGGRNEITEAVNKLIIDVLNEEDNEKDTCSKNKHKITEQIFEQYLYSSNIPDVDLLIRTGGDQRISNFLLWKISYAELYFCEKFWPEFCEEDFLLALYNYQSRRRRYGK